MKNKLYIKDIIHQTMADGPGLRTSIYCSGCYHYCKGCHNPQTWDMRSGELMDVSEIADIILADKWSDVTFTGGDPLYQVEGFIELAKLIKEKSNKNIWLYTGFTIDVIMRDLSKQPILRYVDVVVDGPYIEKQRDIDLQFRGSKNQRIIKIEHCQMALGDHEEDDNLYTDKIFVGNC